MATKNEVHINVGHEQSKIAKLNESHTSRLYIHNAHVE